MVWPAFKALAVGVSGLRSDFEWRLKESKLHIGVALELFWYDSHRKHHWRKRENKTLYFRASVLRATKLSTVVPKGMPVASWQLLQYTARNNTRRGQILNDCNSSAVTYAKMTPEDHCEVFKWQVF